MALLLAKNAPKPWQECERCGSKSLAATYSAYCIKCEQDITRECRTCGETKPLTLFALCSTGISGRARHCKACKEKSRRYGYSLVVKCVDCGTSYTPKSGGDRYCQDCRDKPRPVAQKDSKTKTRINITSVIYMRW